MTSSTWINTESIARCRIQVLSAQRIAVPLYNRRYTYVHCLEVILRSKLRKNEYQNPRDGTDPDAQHPHEATHLVCVGLNNAPALVTLDPVFKKAHESALLDHFKGPERIVGVCSYIDNLYNNSSLTPEDRRTMAMEALDPKKQPLNVDSSAKGLKHDLANKVMKLLSLSAVSKKKAPLAFGGFDSSQVSKSNGLVESIMTELTKLTHERKETLITLGEDAERAPDGTTLLFEFGQLLSAIAVKASEQARRVLWTFFYPTSPPSLTKLPWQFGPSLLNHWASTSDSSYRLVRNLTLSYLCCIQTKAHNAISNFVRSSATRHVLQRLVKRFEATPVLSHHELEASAIELDTMTVQMMMMISGDAKEMIETARLKEERSSQTFLNTLDKLFFLFQHDFLGAVVSSLSLSETQAGSTTLHVGRYKLSSALAAVLRLFTNFVCHSDRPKAQYKDIIKPTFRKGTTISPDPASLSTSYDGALLLNLWSVTSERLSI